MVVDLEQATATTTLASSMATELKLIRPPAARTALQGDEHSARRTMSVPSQPHQLDYKHGIVKSLLRIPRLALNGRQLSGADGGNHHQVHPAPQSRTNGVHSASTGDLSSAEPEVYFTVGDSHYKANGEECATIHANGGHLPEEKEITFNDLDNHGSECGSAGSGDAKGFAGFGWIRGVLIRCVLCIFGATLFMRMSWIAGQAGLLLGAVILLLSFVIVVITAISMSAIATNGEVKGGGCYYLISRSLSPEFGGSIGLILYVANTINASMNCVGLGETLEAMLGAAGYSIFPGKDWNLRIYAFATCIVLQGIIFIGTEFENKTQVALMFTIVISLLSHFVGTLLPVSTEELKSGIVGYSFSVLWDNLLPAPDFAFRAQYSMTLNTFFSVFGVYFPAMTGDNATVFGIMAGANMSGDLKDASRSIPRGTFWAIAITTLTYGWCMMVTGATTLRETVLGQVPVWNQDEHHYIKPPCAVTANCTGGLANDYTIMTKQGVWSPLIIVGIFATTLSSASGCLIGAPRIFQALCEDRLFPLIHPFAKGHGKGNDPFRAYFLTFSIAMAVIGIGDLNAIAELITLFFLAAFAITNFACFDASAAKSPGFRPGFRYYNKWLSLSGAALCLLVMFLLSWAYSLATLLIIIVLFMYLKHNKSRGS